MITQTLQKGVKLWDRFWFGPQDLIQVSLFRMIFGCSLFVFYLIRQFDLEFQLSERGLLPYLLSRQLMPEFYRPPIAWSALLSHSEWIPWIHAGFLLLILTWALGVFARLGKLGRLASIFIFILHLAFSYRNPMVVYGSDMVATCWLFYLCLIDTNQYFRIKFSKKTQAPLSEKPVLVHQNLSSMGIRFIQIQLCIIYAYSGLDKARGVTWWRGDAVWNSLSNGQIVAFDLGFIHHLPLLLSFVCFGVLLWEVYFPVLVWIHPIRKPLLTFGCILHLFISFLMGLPFFAIFMISTYLLFIDAATLRRWLRKRTWLSSWIQFS